jgi:hypothetical protein
VKYIDVDDDVYRELERLAAAWHITVAGALSRFVTTLDPAGTVSEARLRARPAPGVVHGPDARDRTEATSEADEEAVTESPAPGTPGVTWWVCRGCGGATYLDSDADLIADHVRGCERVDGAGNPLPGGGGA